MGNREAGEDMVQIGGIKICVDQSADFKFNIICNTIFFFGLIKIYKSHMHAGSYRNYRDDRIYYTIPVEEVEVWYSIQAIVLTQGTGEVIILTCS